VDDVERWVSVAAGAAIIAYALTGHRRPGGYVLAALPLLYRGITGHCPLYSSLNLNPRATKTDTRSALRDEGGVQVFESVEIERPVAELYRFWRQLGNLPRFMTNLERVTESSPRRSHWVAKGPAGKTVEWDAEIINEVENRIIGWRSLPDADVVTAGSVTFRPSGNGRRTRLSVHLQYDPPAGQLGTMVAAVFGREPGQMIREDLQRLKELFEAGEEAKNITNSSMPSATVHEISGRPGA
jgi:uncharacterized membrane protein